MSIQKENIKAKQNRPEKGLFMDAPKSWQLEANSLGLKKNVHRITKHLLPEKMSILTSLQIESHSLGKRLILLEIKVVYYSIF